MFSEQSLREAEHAYDRQVEAHREAQEQLGASIDVIADDLLKTAYGDASKIMEALSEMDQVNIQALVAAMQTDDHAAIGAVVFKAFREYWRPTFEEDARDSLMGVPKRRRF